MKSELLKNNNECMERIDDRYLEILNNIVSYVRIKLADKESEEAINDILDIFLEAQENEKDINEIVGKDFQKFADEFINSYKYGEKLYFAKRMKKTLIEAVKILPIILIFHIICAAPYEVGNFSDFSNYSYNIKLTHIIFLVGVILISHFVNYLEGMAIVIDKKFNKSGLAIFISFTVIAIWTVYWVVGPTFENIKIIAIPNYMILYSLAIVGALIYAFFTVKKIYDYRKKYIAYINGGVDNE